jgi:hypothetical protein
MNPVLRRFLVYQVGGIVALGILYFVGVYAANPHPLRSSLKLWAIYALIFSVTAVIDLIRLRRR